ncbi:MAG TPA: GatB/YqeY domain-containing protein [Deferrisomatales bacterium]|nr:GatB/YqeY domain-containing protein [Deferrisomatales bacterium]
MANSSTLQERIDAAAVAAMKSREAVRLGTLRMVRAALKNREIDKRAPLEETDVLQVLGTQAKQRRESIEQYRAGGREELAAKEEAELAVLQEFLPRELDEHELRAAVVAAVTEVGAGGPRDMGRVMGVLMPRLQGRADGGAVNRLVREVLAGEADR